MKQENWQCFSILTSNWLGDLWGVASGKGKNRPRAVGWTRPPPSRDLLRIAPSGYAMSGTAEGRINRARPDSFSGSAKKSAWRAIINPRTVVKEQVKK